jgi:hypothetical protein
MNEYQREKKIAHNKLELNDKFQKKIKTLQKGKGKKLERKRT